MNPAFRNESSATEDPAAIPTSRDRAMQLSEDGDAMDDSQVNRQESVNDDDDDEDCVTYGYDQVFASQKQNKLQFCLVVFFAPAH